MKKPQRIGVLGGTFDPIHNAHLEMARSALYAGQLDLVLFVVAARPPHKIDYTVASPSQRLAMVEAAIADGHRFDACDMEMHRGGPSYTCDTLRDLERRYPDVEFFLIVGQDSLTDFPSWKDTQSILSRARMLVAPRVGDGEAIPTSLDGHYDMLPFQELDISSTDVRRRIAKEESLKGLVPEPVERLIQLRGIYEDKFSLPSLRAPEFLRLLRKRLRKNTFKHCVSVAQTMLSFCEKMGITEEQAVTAGLLHDLSKGMKLNELADAAHGFGITENLDTPNLLHGPVAAEECRHELGIDDEAVLDAIRYHTTGRADWNRVGMALFIADFSEPGRGHDAAAQALRMMDEEGFEATLRFVVEQKFGHVKKNFLLDPNSLAFMDWVAHEFAA